VRTARAKGLSERKVIYKHVLKNGLIPVVTILGLQLGVLLAGAIITERFSAGRESDCYWLRMASESVTIASCKACTSDQRYYIVANTLTDAVYRWLIREFESVRGFALPDC